MQINQSQKLANVCYDIRGPVFEHARRLEGEGRDILRLNIGNPAPFGFEAPESLIREISANLSQAHGYGNSKGLPIAREAITRYALGKGIANAHADHVYVGNGVSELITMSMQALLDDGDEVLIPSPDYPLWTAAVRLCGGVPVHYRCDEREQWAPDLEHLASLITPRTKALVVINPNNPTGAVYPSEVVVAMGELARRHGLVLLSDEIYDKILYDGVKHFSTASFAPDVLCLTFNGLSKSYRVAGFRTGWLTVSGPREHAASYLEGMDILANMRLCPNVPSQYAVQVALDGYQSIDDLVLPGGRLLEQRDRTWELLNAIPGVDCVKPSGALYLFPRLDPEVHAIHDDERFVLDLLLEKHILVVQGTAFNWPHPDHFRLVSLPSVEQLTRAVEQIGDFLSTYRH
ncbi:pyridoxal phosphate-dependent aminotransferase [Umezawaea endophytica]|uniref:alanine transaminase n=1 Tax=Umezawaea endophytica TaxID=1654476 RepID=A0A9X2VTA3_9PSEU|nr:pyridoxal phosphate-dependent aminotransferase [Umezawaea endophytica]MCS7482455.1 pyridoxal phosphate-dependent aminotransferase [Umezawaea endophytica]